VDQDKPSFVVGSFTAKDKNQSFALLRLQSEVFDSFELKYL